jgi:hypothetical protein
LPVPEQDDRFKALADWPADEQRAGELDLFHVELVSIFLGHEDQAEGDDAEQDEARNDEDR